MSSFCRCDDSIELQGAPEVLPVEANLKVESNASLIRLINHMHLANNDD